MKPRGTFAPEPSEWRARQAVCGVAEALDRLAPWWGEQVRAIVAGASEEALRPLVRQWLAAHGLAPRYPATHSLFADHVTGCALGWHRYLNDEGRHLPHIRYPWMAVPGYHPHAERTFNAAELGAFVAVGIRHRDRANEELATWRAGAPTPEQFADRVREPPAYDPMRQTRAEWQEAMAAWAARYSQAVEATTVAATALEEPGDRLEVGPVASPPPPPHHFEWFVRWQVFRLNRTQVARTSGQLAHASTIRDAVDAIAELIGVPARLGRRGRPPAAL